MNVLERFTKLFLDEAGAVVAPVEGVGAVSLPPSQVHGAATVGAPEDPEQAARAAVHEAEDMLVELTTRRDSTARTIEGLIVERARAARDLATGGDEAAFASAETSLDIARARLGALDELLIEAEAARREAQLALADAERPRREAERRQRVADATAKAQATRERFVELYAQAAAQLGALADALDELALIDKNAAFNVGYPLWVSRR